MVKKRYLRESVSISVLLSLDLSPHLCNILLLTVFSTALNTRARARAHTSAHKPQHTMLARFNVERKINTREQHPRKQKEHRLYKHTPNSLQPVAKQPIWGVTRCKGRELARQARESAYQRATTVCRNCLHGYFFCRTGTEREMLYYPPLVNGRQVHGGIGDCV